MQVPLGMHLLSGFVHYTRPLWVGLGNLETSSVAEQLEGIEIRRPVYVTGIARAGTTILLEFLAQHPDVATHKYRDFPGVFTPVWWDQGQQPGAAADTPQERAHGDGLAVTADSPEAMEEVIWKHFFPRAHDPQASNVLDRATENPQFEKFYHDHLRKMLLVRGGTRYVAKGNYNLTRLGYLQKLFPEARFVVAVRNPRNHIASLMKQHRLFCNGESNFPRALAYMQRVGHYEFGLDRRPINAGNIDTVRQVLDFWQRGEEVRGWARYWASLYGWLARTLDEDATLAQAVHVVWFDEMCEHPTESLGQILEHCDLQNDELLTSFAARIAAPRYYKPEFTAEEEAAIEEETAGVVAKFESTCSSPVVEHELATT
jgi:hypothetical protein